MTAALLLMVVVSRAIIELILWLIVGRTALRLLAGSAAADNVVLQLFDIILGPPRTLIARLWPGTGFTAREWLLFGLLLSLWLVLGVGKWWLVR
jgi:hypothetical protein